MKNFKENLLQKFFKNASTTTTSSEPQLLNYIINTSVISTLNVSENLQRNLGFPEPILYYLKKNANAAILLKLMKTSKYFLFKEFPFFVVYKTSFLKDNWVDRAQDYQILDLDHPSKPLWIEKELRCHIPKHGNSKIMSNFILKAAPACCFKILYIMNQIITFNEFKCLTASKTIRKFGLELSHVEYENGKVVEMDEILARVPNVNGITWYIDYKMALTINSKTTQKLIDRLNLMQVSSIIIFKIPETFDFHLFDKFMKANASMKFCLKFDKNISIKYSNMLQSYVNKIILNNFFKKSHLICIIFPYQTEKSRKKVKTFFFN